MKCLRFLAVLAAIAVLVSACSDDQDQRSEATLAPTFTVDVPSPTVPLAPPTPVLPPTPEPGVQRVPSSVWLFEAANPKQTVLFEDLDAPVVDAAFIAGTNQVRVMYRPNVVALEVMVRRLSFTGAELSTGTRVEVCTQTPAGIEIRGRQYGAGICHTPSDDERWLLFQKITRQVPSPPGSNYLVPESEMWMLDLSTGVEKRLQDGLVHCGGCDGMFAPAFSSSSRYAYFAETGGEGRVWIADLDAGTSRQISAGPGRNQRGFEPDFAPFDDRIAYIDGAGRLLVEDLVTGSLKDLGVTDVAGRFDPTGEIVFAVEGNNRQAQRTHLFSADSGSLVTTLAGAPPHFRSFLYGLSSNPSSVVANEGSFVAALENAAGCNGTAIYGGPVAQDCIEGQAASVSPDGRKVALARAAGLTGPVQYPGGGSVALVAYDIVLYDVASRSQQVVAKEAISSDLAPPLIVWNEGSTHFLVRLPLFPGL